MPLEHLVLPDMPYSFCSRASLPGLATPLPSSSSLALSPGDCLGLGSRKQCSLVGALVGLH